MAKSLRIGLVGEGPTDFIVIEAALNSILEDTEFVLSSIHPEVSAITDKAGWKGVLWWCEHVFSKTDPLANYDIVIVQVDADIANEPQLSAEGFASICPPSMPTVAKIKTFLRAKMNPPSTQGQVIFCVPSQSTELWVVAMLAPAKFSLLADPECFTNPKSLLYQHNPYRLVVQKGGKLKNDTARYRRSQGTMIENWHQATAGCRQAQVFEYRMSAFRTM